MLSFMEYDLPDHTRVKFQSMQGAKTGKGGLLTHLLQKGRFTRLFVKIGTSSPNQYKAYPI
jgi:hypothetical protein